MIVLVDLAPVLSSQKRVLCCACVISNGKCVIASCISFAAALEAFDCSCRDACSTSCRCGEIPLGVLGNVQIDVLFGVAKAPGMVGGDAAPQKHVVKDKLKCVLCGSFEVAVECGFCKQPLCMTHGAYHLIRCRAIPDDQPSIWNASGKSLLRIPVQTLIEHGNLVPEADGVTQVTMTGALASNAAAGGATGSGAVRTD